MSNKTIIDIHERIYSFVLTVLTFVSTLPKTPTNKIIIYQITKSATSMGANDQEADGASSRKEFIHRYSIVKRERKRDKLLAKINW